MAAEDRVARDIMTSPGIVCTEEATLHEIVELLVDREISGVPVVDEDGTLVGVISEQDLARALGAPLMRLAIKGPLLTGAFLREPHGGPQRARHIMSRPPIFVHPETPVRTLAEIMIKEQVNRLPVVNHGRLVGIVTRGDILGAVAGLEQHAVDLLRGTVEVGGTST